MSVRAPGGDRTPNRTVRPPRLLQDFCSGARELRTAGGSSTLPLCGGAEFFSGGIMRLQICSSTGLRRRQRGREKKQAKKKTGKATTTAELFWCFCVGGTVANFKSPPTNADVLPRSHPRAHLGQRIFLFFPPCVSSTGCEVGRAHGRGG